VCFIKFYCIQNVPFFAKIFTVLKLQQRKTLADGAVEFYGMEKSVLLKIMSNDIGFI